MRFLSIILLTGSMSLLVAQAQNTAAPVSATQPAPVKQVAAPVEKMMEGMLVSADQAKQSLVVKLKGTDYTFQVSGTTEILFNGNKTDISNLAKGTAVRVAYIKANGGRVAKSVVQSVAVKAAPVKAVSAPAAKAATPVAAQPATAAPAVKAAAPVAAQPATVAPAKAAAPVAAQPVPAPVPQPAPKAAPATAPAAQPAPAAVKPAPAPAK